MNKITLFLEKLQGVRRTGNGKYIAKCPAHADRSPSLSIKETSNGDVLFHCFAQCEFGDVLAALNLRASDCFAKSDRSTPQYRRQHKVHEIDSELLMLQSRYGFSPESARALVRVALRRSLGGLVE